MSTADLSGVDFIPLASSLWLGLIAVVVLSFIFKPLLKAKSKTDNASFSSFFQGTIRFNTYIGLAICEGLYGQQGLITAVIIAALLIPPINIFVVSVLQVFGTQQNTSIISTIIAIIKNPLIIGCAIGIGLNVSGIPIHSTLSITIDIVGSTALPLGLMSVGAALVFKGLTQSLLPTMAACAIKLIVYPMIAWYLASLFNLDTMTQNVAIIFCALPTASAAYIMAKNMGGNHRMMAQVITIQTLLSAVSLLFIIQMFTK